MKRWIIVGTAVFALILLVGVVSLWTRPGRRGTAELENWIGRQIVAVVQGYVQPRITFASLRYEPPRTVLISDLSLSAGEQRILSVDRTELQLAEVPRRGKPIQVQRVEFQRPELLFLSQPQGGLLGWSDFLEPEAVKHPETVPEGRRFSDILVLRHVEIHDGQVTYADAGDDSEPMTLPGIELTVDTPPDAEAPGWYRLNGTLRRAPVFRAQLDGRINLDTALLEVGRLDFQLALGEEQYGTLPPALQRFLRAHQVRGELTAAAEGQIPLREPGESEVWLRARLDDGAFAYGGAAFPVGSLRFSGQLPGGPMDIAGSGLALQAGGQTIASVDDFSARLAGLPGAGEPLRVEQMELQTPRLAFWRDGRGGFVGWSDLGIGPGRRGPRLAADVEQGRSTAEILQGLTSSVLLGALQVRDAGVLFETGVGQPLILEGVDAALQTSVAPDDTGVRLLNGTFSRAPFLNGQMEARFNSRTAQLDLDRFQINADLTEAAWESLSPQTRARLHGERLFGQVEGSASARIPLRTPAEAVGEARLEVRNGHFTYRDSTWPFESLAVEKSWPDSPFRLSGDLLEMRSGGQAVLSIPRLAAEIPRLPRAGQPLEVSRLVLDSPRVELRQLPGGGFAGWSELLRGGQRQRSAPGAPTQPAGSPESGSNWRLRSVRAHNGELRLASSGSPGLMSLPGIEVVLASTATPEWYDFTGSVRNAPAVDMSFAGGLNPDEAMVYLTQLELAATLGEGFYGSLPPRIQAYFRERAVHGTVQAQLTGLLTWRDWRRSNARLSAQVQDGHFALGNFRWPLQTLDVQSRIEGGQLTAGYAGTLLGGDVRGQARLTLASPRTFSADWEASGLQLEQLLRIVERGTPRHAGRINSMGTFSAQTGSWPASLTGDGTLQIRQGRLIELPVIRELLEIVARTRIGSHLTRLDEADATFSLHPDHVYFSRAEITTILAALSGRGRVFYDKRLDLEVNVSPLGELQRLAGSIGEAVGRLTGDIVIYRVRGTLSQPEIRVAPLGL